MQEIEVMKKTLELILAAAFAATAGLAAAQMTPAMPNSPANSSPPAPGPASRSESSAGTGSTTASSDTFVKLDSDKDGSVSKKEAATNKSLTAKWDTLDSNKDGKLDQGEFAQFETSGSIK
jgi:hypothetical protein